MEFSYSKQQSNLGIVIEEAEADLLESISSSSSESDFIEKFTSSASSSSSEELENNDPLYDMSSILQQLPRRGFSQFSRGRTRSFGKTRSFASLADAKCIEDLYLPENRYVKRLKSCKGNGGLSETHKSCPPQSSNGSSSSLSAKRSGSFLGNKPPIIPPHKST